MITFARFIKLNEKIGLGVTGIAGKYAEVFYHPTIEELCRTPHNGTVSLDIQQAFPGHDLNTSERYYDAGGILTPTQLFVWNRESANHHTVLRAIAKEIDGPVADDPRAPTVKRPKSPMGPTLPGEFSKKIIPLYLYTFPKQKLIGFSLAEWSAQTVMGGTRHVVFADATEQHPWVTRMRAAGYTIAIIANPDQRSY